MPCRLCGSTSVVRAMTIEDDIVLRRCQSCGLYFHDAFRDARMVREYYANYYDPDNLAFSAVNDLRYRALMNQFEVHRSSGRILDVGCGSGHLLAVARELGWEPHGTEISAGPLGQLAERGIECFHGELRDASYSDGWFDVVHASEVIEHVLDPAALLREMHRVVRPGGLLYLTTPNFDSLSRRLVGARWRVLCREHISYFTPAVARRALSRAGFHQVALQTRNIDPHECRKLFRGARSNHTGFHIAANDDLRRRIDRHASLRAMKGAANWILKATASGDTIIACAIKSSGAGPSRRSIRRTSPRR